MLFDRPKFFAGYRTKFLAKNERLPQKVVDGLNRLLTGIEHDPYIKDIRWAAYMLATSKWETAHTFQPIHEYGGKAYFVKRYGGQTRKGKELGNDNPDEGYYYAGKGDVQLTGESNYERAEDAIRREYPEVVKAWETRTGKFFDLTVGDQPNDETDPMNVMDPLLSYAIMSYGMRTGMFTGKRLSHYITGTKADYKNARKIINGTDHDDEIAAIAKNFETILKAALLDETTLNWVEGELKTEPPATDTPIITPDTVAVPVQTVVVETSSQENKIDSALKTWSARWVAVPAGVVSALGAAWAWITKAPENIILTLIITAGGIAAIYFGLRQISAMIKEAGERREKREAEARAHELQMLLVQSAASKQMNTVALVPPAQPVAEVPQEVPVAE